jgi:hypothetical protein
MSCTTSCGDGIKLPGGTEECEDGNTSARRRVLADLHRRAGLPVWPDVVVDPTELVLPIVLRDFHA